VLATNPRVRLELVWSLHLKRVNRYWKRVTEWDLASTYVLCLLETMLGYHWRHREIFSQGKFWKNLKLSHFYLRFSLDEKHDEI